MRLVPIELISKYVDSKVKEKTAVKQRDGVLAKRSLIGHPYPVMGRQMG